MGPELTTALVIRVLLASLLGGLIGLEREIHGRPAGFRTHLLVSLGSCLFVITSVEFFYLFGNFSGKVPVGVDAGRVAAQVVTGIGFLGGGAIIREKAAIRGLTTAACLWVAAALGIACGIGLFYLAILVTAVALASLLLLKQIERRLSRDTYYSVKVWSDDCDHCLAHIREALAACGLDLLEARYDKNVETQRLLVEFSVKRTAQCGAAELLASLSGLPGINRVRVD